LAGETDVSEEYTADLNDLNSKLSMKPAKAGGKVTLLVSCLAQLFVPPKYQYTLPTQKTVLFIITATRS
jgi:hypothetical protein